MIVLITLSALPLVLGHFTYVNLCSILFSWQSAYLVESLGFWGLADSLTYLSYMKVFSILVVGSLLGALGSFICVKHISTGWAAASK